MNKIYLTYPKRALPKTRPWVPCFAALAQTRIRYSAEKITTLNDSTM